jgi:hypothetical protein
MPRTKKNTEAVSESEKSNEESVTVFVDDNSPVSGETVDTKEETPVSKNLKRNALGLIEGIDYKIGDDGLIDWRKMVKKEFLVPNHSRFPDGTNFKELNVEDLDDSRLLILLGGIKDLAHLRGFSSVTYQVHQSSPNYVAVSCSITWIPNFETSNQPVIFEALADAHVDNTKSFARDFLMAVAENRAFTRAVRNFLRINIVGSDEMGENKNSKPEVFNDDLGKSVSPLDPLNVLNELMKATGVSFDGMKKRLAGEGNQVAETWDAMSDIPKDQVFKLIERLKKKKEGK